jgi:hypothetical protein
MEAVKWLMPHTTNLRIVSSMGSNLDRCKPLLPSAKKLNQIVQYWFVPAIHVDLRMVL